METGNTHSVEIQKFSSSPLTFYVKSYQLFFFSLHVTTSIYPVPSICSQDQISDWFASLAECLHWNVRKKQKHFDELSDLTRVSSDDTLDSLDKSEQS